jgi:hypothetical protein
MSMPPAVNLLEGLPEEIRQHILQYLPHIDLNRLAGVSTIMRDSVVLNLQNQLSAAQRRYDFLEARVGAVYTTMQQLIPQIVQEHPEYAAWDMSQQPTPAVQEVLDLLGDINQQLDYLVAEALMVEEHATALAARIAGLAR